MLFDFFVSLLEVGVCQRVSSCILTNQFSRVNLGLAFCNQCLNGRVLSDIGFLSSFFDEFFLSEDAAGSLELLFLVFDSAVGKNFHKFFLFSHRNCLTVNGEGGLGEDGSGKGCQSCCEKEFFHN